MKRPLLNKLGTVLNTVGSLGVGYYVAKFDLVTTMSLEGVTTLNYAQLFGSALVLLVGLVLRVRDLFSRGKETQDLNHQLDTASETVDRYRVQLGEIESLLERVVERVVDRKLERVGLEVE